GLSRQTVDIQDNYNVEFEEIECTRNTLPSETPPSTPNFCGTGTPEQGGWTITYNRISNHDLGTSQITRWTRKKYTRDCNEPAPSETAILIQDTCLGGFGTRIYADFITTFNCRSQYFDTG